MWAVIVIGRVWCVYALNFRYWPQCFLFFHHFWNHLRFSAAIPFFLFPIFIFIHCNTLARFSVAFIPYTCCFSSSDIHSWTLQIYSTDVSWMSDKSQNINTNEEKTYAHTRARRIHKGQEDKLILSGTD